MSNILNKAEEILLGWLSYGGIESIDEKIVQERAKACSKCPFIIESSLSKIILKDEIKEIQGYKCSLCGCPLSTKVRSKKSKCPDTPSRWEDN